MASRFCPFCGEAITSSADVCPKCYRKIPSMDESVPTPKESRKEGRTQFEPQTPKTAPDGKIALFLALIPGLVGLLGLGQIYRNPRNIGGYIILLIGLGFFIGIISLTFGIGPGFLITFFMKISILPLSIIYGLMYIGAALDVILKSLIVKVRF